MGCLPVDIVHAECFDAMLTQDELLSAINIPETNIDQFLDADQILCLQPPKNILSLLCGEPCQECDWHAVYISTVAGFGSIDIAVGVYPDHSHLPVQSLADSSSSSSYRANRNTVIPSKSQDTPPFFRMSVYLLCKLFRDSRDGEWVLHSAVIRVVAGHKLFVRVHAAIVKKFVTKLGGQLGEETGFNKG